MSSLAANEKIQAHLCTCGAAPAVRREKRRGADGNEEVIYRVACPVCGQLGPAIPAEDKEESTLIAEALIAWNDLILRTRRLEV